MLQALVDYWEDFTGLPDPVKIGIYAAAVFMVGFLIYFAGSSYYSSHKVEKLQKENIELNNKAESALDRMEKAQTAAANEKVRADNLESTLKLIDAQTQKQDENLSISRKSTATTRRDLDALRRSEPPRADADALARRLEARYGKTVDAGSRRQGP